MCIPFFEDKMSGAVKRTWKTKCSKSLVSPLHT